MDFDPRDFDDPRDEARKDRKRSRDDDSEPAHAPRGGGFHDRERDDAQAIGDAAPDRDDDDSRSLGRGGGGSDRQSSDEPAHPRDDARWPDGTGGPGAPRDRHDVFTRHVDLPRGPERERVRDRDRVYTLRGSESRSLATVGAFRVVSSSDLRNHDGSRASLRSGDLRHLREQGLIETARVPGYRDHAVALTKAGHSLLERHRDTQPERRQTFHSGLVRSREREHDLQVYRAYERARRAAPRARRPTSSASSSTTS